MNGIHKIVNGVHQIVNGIHKIVNGKIVNGTARPPKMQVALISEDYLLLRNNAFHFFWNIISTNQKFHSVKTGRSKKDTAQNEIEGCFVEIFSVKHAAVKISFASPHF